MYTTVFFMHFQFIVDATSCAATAPFWYSGSNTTVEHCNLGGAPESERSESQAVCPPKQKDNNGTCIISGGLTDGSWKSSMNLFREPVGDKKYVIHPSVMPEYNSAVSSRASNNLFKDQLELDTRTEPSNSCRLFGIDLRNSNIPSPAKEVKDSSAAADSGKKTFSAAQLEANTAADLDLNKENEKVLLETIEEENMNKHGTCASKRTRTKVERHTSTHVFIPFLNYMWMLNSTYSGANARDCCWPSC